ncbi:MAG: hypothetical protein QM767_04375 [Anaeromyxobacter sp.]
MLDPSRAGEAVAPQAVVGVLSEPDALAATETAQALRAGLKQALAGRPSLTVLLTPDPRGALAPGDPLPAEGEVPPLVYTGGHTGPGGALPTLLELAVAQGAPACALLEGQPLPAGPDFARALLQPVLEGGFDLVAPAPARGPFEGVLVTGIVYPLTRALFGHRLRQPLGPDIVLSRRLAEALLHDESWRTDPAHAGGDLWVITKAIARDSRMAQVVLGPRPRRPAPPADVAGTVARVLGPVFHEMELHAPRWQRVRGSQPVPTFGLPGGERAPEEPVPPPAPGPLVSAFALGWQDLRRLWSEVLPPQTMLALQRIQREPAEAFRVPDAIWARVVYDFAVGWYAKRMDRDQLLRSMTPLYLGWVAGWVNEVAAMGPDQAEARVERLCAAFEAEKPYLISRWRWPDRSARSGRPFTGRVEAMWERVEQVLSAAFGRLSAVLVADLPGLVAMLLVLVGALVVAALIRAGLRRGLARMGFDRRAREWGMTSGGGPLDARHEPSWLIARGAFWFVLLGGVALALDVLGASTTTAVGLSLLGFLPRLVVGALILLVGIGAARFLERSVLIGAVNRQIRQAHHLALAVKWLVLVLAAAMALEHVGVGGGLATLAFGIVLGGVMLAAALAVGLGARDAVARALERQLPDGHDDDAPAPEQRIQHL